MKNAFAFLFVCLVVACAGGASLLQPKITTVASVTQAAVTLPLSVTIVDRQDAKLTTQFWSWSSCSPFRSELSPRGGSITGGQSITLTGGNAACLARGGSVHVMLGPMMLLYDCAVKVTESLGVRTFTIDRSYTGDDTTCSVSDRDASAAFYYKVGLPTRATR